MGIPVYNIEDMFSDEDANTACSCCCCSCGSCSTSSRHTYSTLSNDRCDYAKSKCSDTTTASSSSPTSFHVDNTAFKDIVGNNKEVRIEENTCNLRIVGNNNRIRIAVNTGDLIVIGNNTRLKIQQNHGHIKYTGNDGRICLGIQSSQQLVDYIGCNGILKIVCGSKKSAEAKKPAYDENANENKPPVNVCGSSCNIKDNKLYCHLPYVAAGKNADDDDVGKSTVYGKTTRNMCPSKTAKSKGKSNSFGGRSCSNHEQSSSSTAHWKTFNRIYQEFDRKSMPNLSQQSNEATTACRNRGQAPARIIQTIGNIVIANASNICISPSIRTTA